MADLAYLGFSVDTKGLKKGERALDSYAKTGSKTERNMARSVNNINKEFMSLSRTIGLVEGALAVLGASKLAREVIDYSDTWKGLNSQIRQVTESEEELIATREKLFNLSKETRSEFDATVKLFSEMKRSTDDLGLSTDRQIGITRTLNNLFISGGRPLSEINGAIRQLTQGFAAGALRGDEFNSVAENAPRIMDALANKLRMTRGELREFAATGGITAKIMTDAIEAYSDTAQKLADQTEKTFGQNLQAAKTNIIAFVGQSEEINSAVSTVGDGIEGLSENIDSLAKATESMIAVVGVGLTASLIKSTAATVAQSLSVIAATRANASRIASEVALLQIQKNNLGASIAGITSENIRNTLRTRLTATTASLTAAELSLAAANTAVSRTATTAAIATNALGVATKFLLGPWGLLITALGTAALVFSSSKDESDLLSDSIDSQRKAVDSLQNSLKDLSRMELQRNMVRANERNLELLIKRDALEKKIINTQRMSTLGSPNKSKISELKDDLSNIDSQLLKSTNSLDAIKKLFAEMANEGIKNIKWINELNPEIEKVTKKYQKWLDTVSNFKAPLEQAQEKITKVNDALLSGKLTLTSGVVAYLAAASTELAKFNETVSDTAYDDWIQKIEDSSNPLQKLRDEITSVWIAMDAGDLSESVGLEYLDQLEDKIKDLDKTMSGMDLFSSVTDSIKTSISAMQDMSTEGSKEFKTLGIAIQAVNAIQAVGAVINQGFGDPYTAFARMAAMAGAMAALGQSIGSFGGGIQDQSAANQASQGVNSFGEKSESISRAIETTASATDKLVGINTGMLKALQSLQAGIAGAAGLSARALGGASFGTQAADSVVSNVYDKYAMDNTEKIFGTIFGDTFGAFVDSMNFLPKMVGKLLGGSSSVTDEGIKILGGTMADLIDGASVFAFQLTSAKKHRWSSSHDYMNEVFINDASTQFRLVFDSLADSVFEGGIALGLSGKSLEASINRFNIATTKISLKGLSVEEQQAEIEAVFSNIFNNLAKSVIPFLDEFQRTGEELGETLSRVATQVQITEVAAERLGFTLFDKIANPRLFTQIADNLATLTGGVEEFASKTASFIDDFAPDSVKLSLASDTLTESLEKVGLAVPDSADSFFELMKTIDGSTASGQEQIAAILNIQGVAKDYYDLLEDSSTNSLSSLSSSLRSLIDGINDVGVAAIGMSLDAALSAARVGDFSKALALDLNKLMPNKSDFSSLVDFQIEQAVTANKIAELADLAGGETSIEQMMLNESQEQTALLTSINSNYIPQDTQSTNNVIMLDEMRSMVQDVASIKDATIATAKSSASSANQLRKIELDGIDVRIEA